VTPVDSNWNLAEVEDVDLNQLSISDVMVLRRVRKLPSGTADSAAQVAESYTPPASKGAEFSPTANTEFRKDETLVAYFEISDPLASQEPNTKVRAHLRIVDVQSEEVVADFEPVDAAPYQTAGSQVTAIGRGMSLSNLPVGAYRLEVQATDSGGRNTHGEPRSSP
jgi:hypothetical protein